MKLIDVVNVNNNWILLDKSDHFIKDDPAFTGLVYPNGALVGLDASDIVNGKIIIPESVVVLDYGVFQKIVITPGISTQTINGILFLDVADLAGRKPSEELNNIYRDDLKTVLGFELLLNNILKDDETERANLRNKIKSRIRN